MARQFRPAILRTAAAALAAALTLGGCGSGGQPAADDPMLQVMDPSLSAGARSRAVGRAWEGVLDGSRDRASVRRDLKALAWSPATPSALRREALGVLLSDPDPESERDSRMLTQLMLPRETKPEIIGMLSAAAASRGWTETTASLVRSLSRLQPGVPDTERPEYRALVTLHPQTPVVRVVYGVFLAAQNDAGASDDPFVVNTAERIRADAWDLLARLDADGSLRASMVAGEGDAAADPALADMRASMEELRTLPLTGEELKWLRSLRDFAKPGRRVWWEAAAAAVGTTDRSTVGKLRLHHVEALRLAAAYRPAWLTATREELEAEVQQRLSGRRVNRRTIAITDTQLGLAERFEENRERLSWADLLTILWLDEAIRQPGVAEAVFAQADMDRADGSTEYGGLLHAAPEATGSAGPVFRATMFTPRPAQRRSDSEFVASADMIEQGDHALAHYHFHAQRTRNDEYAGPSPGDLDYAARYGRACLVFTSLRPGVMGVDYYGPSGVVVDLGEIVRPGRGG